jgi:diguanylate cyclase (GGDEF)-like protein
MSQRFIYKQDEVLERVSKGKAETRLLARADRVEIIKQYVPQESTFYLDSAQEWAGFEFIYLLEGELQYLGSEPPVVLVPGDYIARQEIEERSWFRAEVDTLLLYVSSQPAFDIMRDEVREFVELAERIEQDEYTDGHCRRLEKMARVVGQRLGLSGVQLYNLSYAAFFHDLGKAKVPREILQKPTRLTGEEWDVVRKHTVWGREMLEIKPNLVDVARIVGQTHERVDGQGYPLRLTGDEISIEAKIVSVVDTYDAMTTDRPYRKALTNQEALDELQKHAGTQFDAQVVEGFIRTLQQHDPFTGARREWFDQERARLQRREALLRIAEGVLTGREVEDTLNEVVTAITRYTTFRRAALALYDRPIAAQSTDKVQVMRVACSGLTLEEEKHLTATPLPPEERHKIFREEFRISRSYFVPHDRLPWGEHPGLIRSQTKPSPEQRWHPDDSLCIPMWISDEIIGTITVDEPVDGRHPTPQLLEPIEIFASLAAIAIHEAEYKQKLEEASYRDPLTQAFNRRYFGELIAKEAAHAGQVGITMALVLLDFEDFHAINDTCGHLAGDMVLRTAISILQQNVRAGDTVIRYGGDEFLVVMPGASESDARAIAKRLRDSIAEHDFGIPCKVSIRTGFSLWNPETLRGIEEVLAEADRWMYKRHSRPNGNPKSRHRKAPQTKLAKR